MNTMGFSSNEQIFTSINDQVFTGIEGVNVIDPQSLGIGISFNELPDNEPQPYEVVVKDSNDWEEIHDYIINENEIDGIPNRKIECISIMNSEVSTYQMSNEEAGILRNHPKVEFVEKSSLFNSVNLEKRKFYEQFDRYADIDRFKINIENKKTGTPGTALTFTQWGLLRHSKSSNPYPTGTASVNEDIQHSLSGKNVDIVIMDTGVRWDHPEFLKPGYTSVPAGVSTASVSRVRDIIIHGEEEYGIDWTSFNIGLWNAGTGSLSNYTISNVLESSTFNGSWHGSHVAGIAAGNNFGWAYEANIWSIACIDRSDVGFSDPFDGFRYIREWHKNKPINPETGRKNPTILNGSWCTKQFIWIESENSPNSPISHNFAAKFRGDSFSRNQILDTTNNPVPAVTYSNIEAIEITGQTGVTTYTGFRFAAADKYYQQAKATALFNDPDCKDIICIFAAGNQGNKMDKVDGDDYDNYFSAYTVFADLANRSTHYNRVGSPAITHQGLDDAAIVVGSIDSSVVTNIGEFRPYFSNIGPAVDVLSAGENILSPESSGYQDPRNSSFYLNYKTGTSMSTPQVSGILACYVQGQPSMTRVEARKWLFESGSIVLPTDTGLFYDTYKDPVGVGSVNYWSSNFNLRGAEARILYNPTANNTIPSIKGNNLNLSGENLKFKHGFSYA